MKDEDNHKERTVVNKRMLAVAAAAAAMVIGAALPAQAADQSVVVFTAGASVGAPVFAPGLGNGVDTTFTFSTANAGLGGQKACIAVHSRTGFDNRCDLASSGTFGKGLGNIGAYCGWSSGQGTVDKADINGSVLPAAGLSVAWPQSAGTALPLVYTSAGKPAGVGAVQTTGAQPGSCGVGGGTTSFAVTGFSVLNG